MDAEIIRNYCLAMPDAIEQMPFGPNVLVFKVNTKMFCLLALDEIPTTINVKCDPEIAIELREKYSNVIPGYHMNKKYWNTIIIDGSIPSKLIKQFIEDSYNLVKQKAKKNRILNDNIGRLVRHSPRRRITRKL